MKYGLLMICISFFSVVLLSPFSGCALSQSETVHPTLPVAVPVNVYSGVVGCDVNGYVLDTYGNPVSNAVVTVRQNGHILNPSGGEINGYPDPSGIYSYGVRGDVGYFDFIVYSKGHYMVTAEIDGYNSSIDVLVKDITFGNSVSENITMNGYHTPILTKDQLAYTGTITGVVLDRDGVLLPVTNVSLWKDGRLVRIPNNPQYSAGGKDRDEFIFEHVPPGHYELLADVTNRLGGVEGRSVDVYDRTITANITMHNYTYFVMGPVTTSIPDQVIPRDAPKPTPFTSNLFVLSYIVTAVMIYGYRKKL